MKSLNMSAGDRAFIVLVYAILFVAIVGILLPFLYMIANSFSTNEEAISNQFYLLPKVWSINSYGYLLSNDVFLASLTNSVTITAIGTLINMAFTASMAYALSKSWMKGRRTLNFIVIFTMLFSGGIIPTYILVRSLHLLNSYWSIWLTGAIAPFNLIVMRSFFQNIPKELDEAARIDGCSEFRLLWSVYLPLSRPAMATFTLFYMVQNWNTFFQAILYLNDSGKWPLQVFLQELLISSDASMAPDAGEFTFGPPVKMAAVILTALPLLLLYPFLQKHFNKGMLIGSVKG